MVEDKRLILTSFLSTLLLLTFVGSVTIPSARAELDSTSPVISMPDESLNYTILEINGAPWAIIDGYYPIYQTYGLEGNLPMVYPTPPGTTNITLTCNSEKLNWTDYNTIAPGETHNTDIGNWSMIFCLVPLTSNNFVLTIHYEHPVQIVNGTYMFLYDLNISPYLSSGYNVSTAHFTVRWESQEPNIKLYTTGNVGSWSQREFSSVEENGIKVMRFDIVSDFSKPLPGDIVITFNKRSNTDTTSQYFFVGLVTVTIVIILAIVAVYRKQRRIHLGNKSY